MGCSLEHLLGHLCLWMKLLVLWEVIVGNALLSSIFLIIIYQFIFS